MADETTRVLAEGPHLIFERSGVANQLGLIENVIKFFHDFVADFDPDTDIGIEFVSLVFKLKSLSDELADDILHRLRAEIWDPVRRRAP